MIAVRRGHHFPLSVSQALRKKLGSESKLVAARSVAYRQEAIGGPIAPGDDLRPPVANCALRQPNLDLLHRTVTVVEQ
jgi:hypothetical protein